MVSERSRRAHEIFVRVLDVEPGARAALLREACGADAPLRAEVDRLLGALTRSTGFLEGSALGRPAPATATAPAPPEAIAGYRIVRVLGAGGMATVYEAEQLVPRRRVALKIVHTGLAHTSAGSRLLFEADVLARLKHPAIAQIYEVGTTGDSGAGQGTRQGAGLRRGVPFFAMEYVDGARTITDHAREAGLSLRQRLAMLADVCDAVQHGHQLGIIHRDLKPGNILVGSDARPKIIDFGIARSVLPDAERITLAGERGQIIGTLNAMSPEQCSGEGHVDTRSDVYSLGVVLYELVTGRVPLDVSRRPILEAIRTVQREAPRRPSAIVPRLEPELDAVILKALEKEPRDRYPTASELAGDLRRFLDNRPVLARPATTIEQVRKFARRNRPVVAGTAAVIVLLAGAAGVSARMAIVADRARTQAEQRGVELAEVVAFQQSQLEGIDVAAMGDHIRAAVLERARGASAGAAGEPTGADGAAMQRRLDAVNFTSVALSTLDTSILRRSRAAIDEQFAGRPLVRARLLMTLASTMNTLGLKEQAEPVLADALAIRRAELGDDHEETVESTNAMGELLGSLGRRDEAMTHVKAAYEARARRLGPEHPDTLRSANALGGLHRRRGEFDDARRIWGQTLEARRRTLGPDDPATLISLNNFGVICAVQDDLAEAEAAWRELLERRRRLLGEDHADYRHSLSNLGLLLHEQGKLEEARPLLEEALAALRRAKSDTHPSTLETMASVADLLEDLKDFEASERLLRECIAGRTRTLGPEHEATLRSMVEMAELLANMGRVEEASAVGSAALAAQRRTLGDAHADTVEAMGVLASVEHDAGRFDRAEALAREAVERSRRNFPQGHRLVALQQLRLGRALAALQRRDEAEATLLEAHALFEAQGRGRDPKVRECEAALVALYEGWHAAAPGNAHDVRAARWRAAASGK